MEGWTWAHTIRPQRNFCDGGVLGLSSADSEAEATNGSAVRQQKDASNG